MLREHLTEYFDLDVDSPYMLLVAPVTTSRRLLMTKEQESLFAIEKLNISRSDIRSVMHLDYLASLSVPEKSVEPN